MGDGLVEGRLFVGELAVGDEHCKQVAYPTKMIAEDSEDCVDVLGGGAGRSTPGYDGGVLLGSDVGSGDAAGSR